MYIKPEHHHRNRTHNHNHQHQGEDIWMSKMAGSGIVKKTNRTALACNNSNKVVLPSFQAFCKPVDGGDAATPTLTTRAHARNFSVPVCMPSQQQKQNPLYYSTEEDNDGGKNKQQQRLSLGVLLDAIELDQTMYEAYRLEHTKTSSCDRPSDRRRSKSAPGSSTITPRWRAPMRSSNISMQQLAESIVRQHIENAKRK